MNTPKPASVSRAGKLTIIENNTVRRRPRRRRGSGPSPALTKYAWALKDPYHFRAPPLGFGVIRPLPSITAFAESGYGALGTDCVVLLFSPCGGFGQPTGAAAGTAPLALFIGSSGNTLVGMTGTQTFAAANSTVIGQSVTEARTKCAAMRCSFRYPTTSAAPYVYGGQISTSYAAISGLTPTQLMAHPAIRPIYCTSPAGSTNAQVSYVPQDLDYLDLANSTMLGQVTTSIQPWLILVLEGAVAGSSLHFDFIVQMEANFGANFAGIIDDGDEPETTLSESVPDISTALSTVTKIVGDQIFEPVANLLSPIITSLKNSAQYVTSNGSTVGPPPRNSMSPTPNISLSSLSIHAPFPDCSLPRTYTGTDTCTDRIRSWFDSKSPAVQSSIMSSFYNYLMNDFYDCNFIDKVEATASQDGFLGGLFRFFRTFGTGDEGIRCLQVLEDASHIGLRPSSTPDDPPVIV